MTTKTERPFVAGDKVVFKEFKTDTAWAPITEDGGRVRTHPVIWMAHVAN